MAVDLQESLPKLSAKVSLINPGSDIQSYCQNDVTKVLKYLDSIHPCSFTSLVAPKMPTVVGPDSFASRLVQLQTLLADPPPLSRALSLVTVIREAPCSLGRFEVGFAVLSWSASALSTCPCS